MSKGRWSPRQSTAEIVYHRIYDRSDYISDARPSWEDEG